MLVAELFSLTLHPQCEVMCNKKVYAAADISLSCTTTEIPIKGKKGSVVILMFQSQTSLLLTRRKTDTI